MDAQSLPLKQVVERLNWRATRYLSDSWETEWSGWVLLPGARRVRSFDTEDEAHAFLLEQENRMRAAVNPFTCGGPALHYQSSYDDDRLHDWLVDASIEPPLKEADGSRDWRGWYEKAQLPAEQRAVVWQVLDKVRFHRLSCKPTRRTVYVLTRRDWDYNDQWYYPTSAEGQPIEAYSTYEKAEEVRLSRERSERRQLHLDSMETTTLRWAALEPPAEIPDEDKEDFATEEDRLHFEVVEIELED